MTSPLDGLDYALLASIRELPELLAARGFLPAQVAAFMAEAAIALAQARAARPAGARYLSFSFRIAGMSEERATRVVFDMRAAH